MPPGIEGARQTLAYMSRFVDQYKTHPAIRELALKLTSHLPQKDFKSECVALFRYVRDSIRYVRDIDGVETLQTPLKTLEYGAGDCDDKSTLLAALLASIGCESRFYAVGFRPNNVCHVLLEAKINGDWVALDTTEPRPAGWTPPDPTTVLRKGAHKMRVPAINGRPAGFGGLGINPALVAAGAAMMSDQGGGGGGGGSSAATGPETEATNVSPSFQQAFTPQFSPNLIQSSGSGDVIATATQIAPGGQTARTGSASASGPGATGYPSSPPYVPTASTPSESYRMADVPTNDVAREYYRAQSTAQYLPWAVLGIATLAGVVYWRSRNKAR